MKNGLSLSQILEIASLQGCRVLAGDRGLGRMVTSVTVGEVPDIARWLTGGELVLSTFFAVSTDQASAVSLARSIISSPGAALAFKPARFLDSIPDQVLGFADERGFPIVEVPPHVRWTTVISDVYAAMSDADPSGIASEDELLRSAIDGRGLDWIAREAAARIGAPVVIVDTLPGVPVHGGEVPAEIISSLREELRGEGAHSLGRGKARGERVYAAAKVRALNVIVDSEVAAIAAVVGKARLSRAAHNLLKRTAEAAAVEIARERAVEDARAKMQSSLLDDVARGLLDETDALKRFARLGLDLSEGFTVMLCAVDPAAELGRFTREVSRSLAACFDETLTTEHRGSLVTILGGLNDVPKERRDAFTRRCGRGVLAEVRRLGGTAGIGVSRGHAEVTQLPRALDEARVCLEVGARSGGGDPVVLFDEIGVHRLLVPLIRDEDDNGRAYYEETIGPLADYDKANGTDLVATLEAFKKHDENLALAAEELHTHRHTVRYRLQRIAQITGCDPSSADGREKLYMALHVRHLLGL